MTTSTTSRSAYVRHRFMHCSRSWLGLLPLPLGEGWGEGLRSPSLAGYPLTPTLSPSGEREHTELVARASANPRSALPVDWHEQVVDGNGRLDQRLFRQ